MGEQLGRVAHGLRDASQLAGQLGDEPARTTLAAVARGGAARRLRFGVLPPGPGGRAVGRGVGLEVDEAHRHAQPTHAVGDGVVQLGQQRGATAFEAVHNGELPQRAGGVEGVLGHQGGQVQELALDARRWQGHVADVVVEVELGIVHPLRDGQRSHGHMDALAETGGVLQRALDATSQAGHVGAVLQDGHVGERGAQHRVALDAPHQRLGGCHARARACGGHDQLRLTARHGAGPGRSAGDGRVLVLVELGPALEQV